MRKYSGRFTATHHWSVGKIPVFLRVTPICCNSWPMIWFTRRYRFRSRESMVPTPRMRAAQPLKLETLFGSGPVGSPFVYAQDAPNDERRTKLRLGRMRWKDKDVEAGCPFRDIARAPAENVTGIDRSIAGHRVALTEALVADPRNDDHAIMSQLTALFALLHNGLIDWFAVASPPPDPMPTSAPPTSGFLCARGAVTVDLSQHHPQGLDATGDASGDLRGLRRLRTRTSSTGQLNAEQLSAGDGASQMAGKSLSSSPTAHFASATHGPARISHQRSRDPRPKQDAGKDLGKRSRQHAARLHMDRALVALLRNRTGRGRISAGASAPILSDGLGNDQIFPAFDETNRVGLLYRDLLGAAIAGLWSVDALIAEIAVRRPHFISMSRLLADRLGGSARFANGWLRAGLWRTHSRRHRNPCQRSTAAVLHLVRGDAAAAGGGPVPWAARLDHSVGSDLRRARQRRVIRIASTSFACRGARRIFRRILSDQCFCGRVPEIERMDQLVEFTAEIG